MIFCLIEYHLCKQTNITRILGNFMKSHFLVAKNSITVSTLVFTKELQQCLGLIGMLFRSIEYHLCFCRQSFRRFCVTLMSDWMMSYMEESRKSWKALMMTCADHADLWGHSITTWTQFCRFLTTFLDLSKYLDVDISSVKWTKRHFLDYLPTSSCPHSHWMFPI